jgi:hypothetical protein
MPTRSNADPQQCVLPPQALTECCDEPVELVSRCPFSLLAKTLEIDRRPDHRRVRHGLDDVQDVEGRFERECELDGMAQSSKRWLGEVDGDENPFDPHRPYSM